MTWDYIIVGAGSAGCAVACELIKSGQTVLLIEAGGWDRSPFIRVAAGHSRACAKHDWGYQSQPDRTRNGATEAWTRGRVVGGSSSINGTMFVRGSAADFDRWCLPGWSAEDVMPIFRDFESSDQLGPLRGHTGPQHVRTVKRPHAVSEAFVRSAIAAGYAFNQDYNGAKQEGVGYAQLSQRRGFRCSAADAFLKPMLWARNVKLLLYAMVEKIELENDRAVAVRFQHRGRRQKAIGRDIILCAGAINSPKLLMLSGIGDAQELKAHKIDSLLNLPAVGRYLKEHPLVTLGYRSRIATYNLTRGLPQKLGIVAEFLLRGEGPISNLFEAVAFVRTFVSAPVPDIQLLFLPVGFDRTPDGRLKLASYPSFTVLLLGSYPASTGRVSLASSDPGAAPLIEPQLLQREEDVETLVRGVEAVRGIMQAEPMASLVEGEIAPGVEVQAFPALRDYVRAHTGISFHALGTCRMGIGTDSVVGPDLRVHGTRNLWVGDASIMPDQISANLNAACMMIGVKLGKQLAARSK